MKRFNKEESGALFVEFVVLLGFVGVSAVILVPIVRTQLTNIYENQSNNIIFSGHRLDSSLDATPQTNPPPEVDYERKTQ